MQFSKSDNEINFIMKYSLARYFSMPKINIFAFHVNHLYKF